MADENMNLTTKYETDVQHPQFAAELVQKWAVENLYVLDDTVFYVVWFAFILGGWKALVSSTDADGRYYEITFDKDEGVAYLDTYKKTHNVVVPLLSPNK